MAAIKSAGEDVTSLSSAKALTTIPGNAQRARIVPRGANIHYREDGGTPTSSVGTPVVVSGSADIVGRDNLLNCKIIEDSASATVWVEYFDSLD